MQELSDLIQGSDKIMCYCGKEVSLNGITSHSRKCKRAFETKKDYVLSKLPSCCIYCARPFEYNSFNIRDIKRAGNPYFCSNGCNSYAGFLVKIKQEGRIKKCICGKDFIVSNNNPKSCSRECANIQISAKTMAWHEKHKDTLLYKKRCQKISNTRLERKIGVGISPWNKGLRGEEYLKHYIDEKGNNRLYAAIQKNQKFFKKTSIEDIMQEILEEIGVDFKYSFFYIKHQYDFYVALDEVRRIIIECDGDYYHKSTRKCDSSKERAICRTADEAKAAFIVKGFSKKNRQIAVIRFWEYDINNNREQITKYLLKLQKGIQYEETLLEIEKHYNEHS